MTAQIPTFSGTHDVHIYYEDTDFTGLIYHANYLKFFERAREHMIGIDYLRELYARQVHFVVKNITMDFRAPGGHGNHLRIKSTCQFNRGPRLIFRQEAYLQPTEKLLVAAEIKIVTIDGSRRPIRMPDDVYKYFSSLG